MPASYESSDPAPADHDRLESLVSRASETGVVQIVNAILTEALREGASAIHLEPRRQGGIVRYRLAGELCEALALPPELLLPVTSRLKLMAGLDLSEHRAPQQGRIPLEYRRKPYDLPVGTMPTLFGERLVMRIVDPAMAAAWTWEKLGFGPVETLRALLSRSQGLILFTGPPASGKTAALTGALHALDADRLNIVAVAGEHAYHIEGVNRSRAGLPARDAIRALTQRDTDVLVIDEARDREAIEAALEAALAGPLVLAAFPAGDGVDAIERLIALGISTGQLAAGLSGIVASRLARRICPSCREPDQPSEESLRALGITPEQAAGAVFTRGKGCDHCRGSGSQGSVGLYRVLVIDPAAARHVADLAAGDRPHEPLAPGGLPAFREEAAQQALAGAVTVAEALRFVKE